MPFRMEENDLNYDTYTSLRKSVGWEALSKEQCEQALKNTYYSIVIYSGDEAVAMGRVVGDGIYFLVTDVVVSPDFQGNGIGASIIERILSYIEDNLCSGGRASIQLISEVGKEEFYLKQGFKLIPHEFCGPALRKVLYKQ